MQRDVEQLRQRALIAAQASVKLRDLEREVDVNRGVYQSLFARSRQAEEAQPSNLMSTHIVTMASPPAARSFPPSAVLMMAAGFVLGSLLGSALAIVLELRKNADGSPTAIARAVDLDPDMMRYAITDATRFVIRPAFHSRSTTELARLGAPVASRSRDGAEIDGAMSHLLSLINNDSETQIIALVGDARNEARTIMAINIALALSAAGLDVALVDADAKRAYLTSLVDLDAARSGKSREFIVQTREEVVLALPNRSAGEFDHGDRNRIMRDLLRGEMGPIDAVLCDGAFDDPSAFEQINWVVPVVGAEADEREAIGMLPEVLASKIAFILHFEHTNPWAEQSSKLVRTA